MKPFTTLQSRAIPLPIDNIDTDQIIPARFLKGVDRQGLGEGLFANWRDDPGFVLNQSVYAGAQILISGDNFGCGSSREHAPWALLESGFRVVISSRFGDIFRSNALKNGLLPIVLPDPLVRQLLRWAADPEGLVLEVDLEGSTVRSLGSATTNEPPANSTATTLCEMGGDPTRTSAATLCETGGDPTRPKGRTGYEIDDSREWSFEVDPFSRRCLLDGVDQLGYLLQQIPEIERWEAATSPRVPTTTPPQEHRA